MSLKGNINVVASKRKKRNKSGIVIAKEVKQSHKIGLLRHFIPRMTKVENHHAALFIAMTLVTKSMRGI